MKRLSAAIFLLASLSACAMYEEASPQLNEEKALAPKISLDVKTITLTDRSAATAMNALYTKDDLRPTLSDAVKQWAVDHLQARGAAGQAIVVIKKASFAEQPIPIDHGIESWFMRQQASKYVARIDVSIEASSPDGFAVTDASAYRTVTLPEDPTPSERTDAYDTMLRGLMQDLGNNLEAGIRKHMVNFLVAPPVFGATAVPMATTMTISVMPSADPSADDEPVTERAP